MKRTVAQQETSVNCQDTSKIKQFPLPDISSEETGGETGRVEKIKKLAAWTVKKRESQGISGGDISEKISKSHLSKIEKGNIKSITLDTLYELAKGLNTTIDEPLRAMGYLPTDSVTVHGEVGRFLANYQELPDDWKYIVSQLTLILWSEQQRKFKNGNG